MRRFEAGETAVRRDVFRGRVWSAHAASVVEDGDGALVLGNRPGAEGLAPTTWIESLTTGRTAARAEGLASLARGDWELGRWAWRRTVMLQYVPPETWFSVNAFYDPADGHRLTRWYVNFQRPMHRTALGFDTFDLLVDLVVAPDLSRWEWKDEDEYAQGRRLGVVGDGDHRAVERAREEALALIAERGGPFATEAGGHSWRSEADAPLPVLPADVLAFPG